METTRFNSCQHSQVLANPGSVAQYPQAVVPVYYPTSFVPCASPGSAPDLSVGLQYRSVARHDSVQFYQQTLQQPMATTPCQVAQVVEKRSETKSGSLVEYSYLPAAGGGFQPFPYRPEVSSGRNGFARRNRVVNPGFGGPRSRPVRRYPPHRPSFQPNFAGGWGGYRPSYPPQAVANVPQERLRGTTTMPMYIAQRVGGRDAIAGVPPGVAPAPVINAEALKITCPNPGSNKGRPLPLPKIDLAALLPEPCPEGEVDSDMQLLYLQHLLTSQLPEVEQSGNFLARVQENYILHNSPDIPGFDERQRMIASLSSHFEETGEFEDICKNNSHCTFLLRKMQRKGEICTSDIITPAHCILLCLASVLPCTGNHNVSVCAPYLHPYKIPFSTIESLMTDSAKSKKLRDVPGDELLQSDNGTDQLSIILQVMSMLAKTFPIKLRQLKAADGVASNKDAIIHSKFVAHMVLTALLYCQHDASTQNISRFLSITSCFLKHLTSINQFPDLCDEAGLNLTRAMLTLLSHDIAKTELLPLMHGIVRNAKPLPPADPCWPQQEWRSKNGLAQLDKLEDSLVRKGRALTRSLQSLIITTLKHCLKPNAAPYYFATLATLSALPLFTPLLIRRENSNWKELIRHLTDVIEWMVQSLQKDSRCYTDFALLRKIIDNITSVWIPGLSFQVATMAGWQPCTHLHMSYRQWLIKQLKAPAGGRLKQMPELLILARGLEQLEQGALRKMIEEDELSREFEVETNALIRRVDELSLKKNQQITRKPIGPMPQQGRECCRHQQDHCQQPSKQQPPSPLPAFVTKVTDFCRELDYSTGLADLKAAIPQDIEDKLAHPGHQLWLYTEMAFQGFHQHRELIVRSAKAMGNAWRTQKKLTEALAESKAEFVSKWQSSSWLNERFTPSELSPKRLANMSIQTEPEKLALARRVMSNVLALLKLAIKPGSQLLDEMSKGSRLDDKLPPNELMVHFDICHEAMQMLVGRLKTPLEREVISHEIPRLKTQLFEQLHLYGANSFEQTYHEPEDTESLRTLKALEQGSDAYREYNRQPFDKVDAQELLSNFRKIYLGLLRHWHNYRIRAPNAAGQAPESEPEVPGPDSADQQSSAIDADAREHQKGGLGDPPP